MTCLAPSSQGDDRPAWGGQEAPAPWGAGRALPVRATLPRARKGLYAQRASHAETLKISLTDFFKILKSLNFDNGPTVGTSQSGHPA
jgi:hypothetical protein